MTSVRRELLYEVRARIATIPDIRFFDWQKGQFEESGSKNAIPLPACLMEISSINYVDRMQQLQEGRAVVSLYLYMGQGLAGLSLIDAVVEAVQWLRSERFKPLSQRGEQSISRKCQMLAYRLDFETRIYNPLKRRFVF